MNKTIIKITIRKIIQGRTVKRVCMYQNGDCYHASIQLWSEFKSICPLFKKEKLQMNFNVTLEQFSTAKEKENDLCRVLYRNSFSSRSHKESSVHGLKESTYRISHICHLLSKFSQKTTRVVTWLEI